MIKVLLLAAAMMAADFLLSLRFRASWDIGRFGPFFLTAATMTVYHVPAGPAAVCMLFLLFGAEICAIAGHGIRWASRVGRAGRRQRMQRRRFRAMERAARAYLDAHRRWWAAAKAE